jgi:ATP-dependent DNA ligase
MEYLTLYSTARTGAVRVWEVAVDGDRVITRFGQRDGKMQEVVDYGTAKNVGRSNEISAAEDAENMAKRLTKQKMRKGYRKTLPEVEDFDPWAHAGLPDNLSFYKPQNSMNKKMEKLVEAGEAWALRKYDGEMMVIVKDPDGIVDIYSRRMLRHHHNERTTWRVRFEHLVYEIENNGRIPAGTVLLGEMVASPQEDNRWYVAKVLKSLTDRAMDLQEEHGLLHFICWDAAWVGREELLGEVPVGVRLDHCKLFAGKYLRAPEMFFTGHPFDSVDALRDLAARKGYEGFVVVDPDSTYGDKGFNLRGKPDRPAGACKLKPCFEDDFQAFWDPDNGDGKYGRGKYAGKLGAVSLYQINSEGQSIYISECGNGFTKEFIENNSSPDDWPKVIKVKYESRTYVSKGDKTNALQFPRFVCVREDKDPEECINPEL